jgi:hypothetical protein
VRRLLGASSGPPFAIIGLSVPLRSAVTEALEKAKADKEAHGEFDSECPGYCGAQDTFYVGTLKGVGRIYQQTFIDTYAKVAFAKLYDRKTPIIAAEILNDRVVRFYDQHGIRLWHGRARRTTLCPKFDFPWEMTRQTMSPEWIEGGGFYGGSAYSYGPADHQGPCAISYFSRGHSSTGPFSRHAKRPLQQPQAPVGRTSVGTTM